MSLAGISSRRRAEELIQEGRVALNGRVVKELGTKATWGADTIEVDGKGIPGPFERIYIMLNKPFGYVSSLRDPLGRPVVTDLLKGVQQRVYPVGRLDFDSMGLLLLTNDGEWAYRLTHPGFHVPKTYKLTVKGKISQTSIDRLRKGVLLEDGYSGPCKVTLVSQNERQSIIRVTVTSGKRHLLRRMLEAVGHHTLHLIRTGFGTLELGQLKNGAYRYLESQEIEQMKKLVGLA